MKELRGLWRGYPPLEGAGGGFGYSNKSDCYIHPLPPPAGDIAASPFPCPIPMPNSHQSPLPAEVFTQAGITIHQSPVTSHQQKPKE